MKKKQHLHIHLNIYNYIYMSISSFLASHLLALKISAICIRGPVNPHSYKGQEEKIII